MLSMGVVPTIDDAAEVERDVAPERATRRETEALHRPASEEGGNPRRETDVGDESRRRSREIVTHPPREIGARKRIDLAASRRCEASDAGTKASRPRGRATGRDSSSGQVRNSRAFPDRKMGRGVRHRERLRKERRSGEIVRGKASWIDARRSLFTGRAEAAISAKRNDDSRSRNARPGRIVRSATGRQTGRPYVACEKTTLERETEGR
jgi:hypothetical protein